jgi:hypothetical protein
MFLKQNMKKYLRVVSIFLLTVLTLGKNASASSTKLYKIDEVKWLKNLKESVASFIEPLDFDNDEENQMRAKRNLEKASKHKLLRPILVRAFREIRKEYEEVGAKKKASQAVQEIFWKRFSDVEKMYL